MPPTAQMFKLISDWRKQRIETEIENAFYQKEPNQVGLTYSESCQHIHIGSIV